MQVGAVTEAYFDEVDLQRIAFFCCVTKRRFIVLTYAPFGTTALCESLRRLSVVIVATQALL